MITFYFGKSKNKQKTMLPKEHNLQITQVLNPFPEHIFSPNIRIKKIFIFTENYVWFLSECQKQPCLKKSQLYRILFFFFFTEKNIFPQKALRGISKYFA